MICVLSCLAPERQSGQSERVPGGAGTSRSVRFVQLTMKRSASILVLVVTCAGCGSEARGQTSVPSPSAGGSVTTLTTTPPTKSRLADTVASVEAIGTIPFDIGPLPEGQQPALTVDDVLAVAAADGIFGRFLATPADLDTLSIKVGLITDHSNIADTTGAAPTFIGYVLVGGHSTCVWSGPPTTDNRDHEGPCHGMLLVDGNSGQVLRQAEIGD